MQGVNAAGNWVNMINKCSCGSLAPIDGEGDTYCGDCGEKQFSEPPENLTEAKEVPKAKECPSCKKKDQRGNFCTGCGTKMPV